MLSDKELIKNVDLAIARCPEVFDALLDFEKTHRIKKINYKERANFTIDSNLLNEFREYCRKKGMKMSAKIEQFIEEEINKTKP